MTARDIAILLQSKQFRQGSEALLQQDIENLFIAQGMCFHREYRLAPGERIDFLVGDVGIEAKLRADRRAIFRQLTRYARTEQINSLILISGTTLGLPPSIEGKPVFFVSLGRSAL